VANLRLGQNLYFFVLLSNLEHRYVNMMIFMLLSTLLTSAFAQAGPGICDQSHLAHFEQICEAKGRRLLQAGEMDAINARDRIICACADLLETEERNCYVHEGDSLTLQEQYDAHCSDLNAQQTMEEQVGFLSALFGDCTDASRAHCTDKASSEGCPAHWVTHEQEYNNACGWWWSREPCDRCCESGKNIVDSDQTGGRGGTCTCPDGFTYPVGDSANCVDGTVTAATEHSTEKVTCRKFVKTIVATNQMIITGCESSDTTCGFEYNLDQTLGASASTELENSVERNSDPDEDEDATTTSTTKQAQDVNDNDFNWAASAMVGATFSAGAQTRFTAGFKGSISYGFSGDDWTDLNEMKLRMELNNMGFEMESKIALGLEAGVELSGTQKIKLGPDYKVGPQTINIPVGTTGLVMPVMVSLKVQPVAHLSISGNVAAAGMFTIENVYHMSYSDMFIEFDLMNFATSENLDTITQTEAYSDMYTMLLSGELGFQLRAHIGVEVDFMLYETVGVSLTPAVSTKFSAGGSAEYLKRWSTSTVLPPGQVTHACHMTACIGGFVDAGLTWIGAELADDVASVKEMMGFNRRQLGRGVSRRQLAPLSFGTQLQQACQTEIECTMGIFAGMLVGVCDFDPSSLLDISLEAPDFSLEPPSMRLPIGEVCYTIGQEDGEFYHHVGTDDGVACASGRAMTCAGCRPQSNCGGDCEWKRGACKPQDEDYSMSPGAVCGGDYEAITSGWRACKTAAESLGYTGDTIAHVSNTIASSSRPQGCFIQGDDNNRVHYNTNNGIAHGNKFVAGDAIICVAGVATEKALGGLSFDALNYSSENGPRNILLTGFATIGLFSTIVYLYQKTFNGKYETIPHPSVEEI
jgi:hypothetical protein